MVHGPYPTIVDYQNTLDSRITKKYI